MEFNEPAGPARPPEVDEGYRAGQLLGSGATARVWAVAREGDGARFALKIPAAAPGGPGTTFETRRELNILSRFEHENLLRVHTVLDTDQGPGLLMEWAQGGSLGRVLQARGTLQPGEAVTVLVGVASVLAYLHTLNVCHGEVSPNNILFTSSGKPLLADLGTAALLGTGRVSAASQEGDVLALASVGWLILTGRALPPAERRLPLSVLVPEIPAALAEVIDAGLQEETGLRPDAAEFARRVFESMPAEPLNLALAKAPGPAGGLPTRRSRLERGRAAGGLRRRVRRANPGQAHREGALPEHREEKHRPNRVLLGAAAVLVAATMGLGAVAVAAPEILQGAASGEPETAPPASGAAPVNDADKGADPDIGSGANTPAPTGTDDGSGTEPGEPAEQLSLARTTDPELQLMVNGSDPVAAARALAELRARAFTAADAELLTDINVPRSPAMQADQAEISKLEASGTVLSGLAVEIVSAGPAVPGQEGKVSLRAAVSTSAYAERDARGAMVRNVAAISNQDVVLVMVRTADGWRIEDILAPPA
ncbi:protein kinase domain-containing protein [Arthrobacter sunyaminii]|uniref:protein kinase domain-containing protein n=1 Tax=Arthrobacter sunyaminii TaxID=2816859 RepID=UPI001A941C10|nr:protein kinase [Arthrobacter sunyaminii]MBO0895021.1 protein kinase [Arthrobacter sunyaminii]